MKGALGHQKPSAHCNQKTSLQQIEEKDYARLPKGCRQGLGMAQTGLGITVSALLSLINV